MNYKVGETEYDTWEEAEFKHPKESISAIFKKVFVSHAKTKINKSKEEEETLFI